MNESVKLFNRIATKLGYPDLLFMGRDTEFVTRKRIIRVYLVRRYKFKPFQLERQFKDYEGFNHSNIDNDISRFDDFINLEDRYYIDIAKQVLEACEFVDTYKYSETENEFENEEQLISNI